MISKIALATALVLSTASAALAFEFDPNLANRYPQASASQVLEGRNVALTGGENVVVRAQTVDRAGNAYAGGGF